MQQRLEGAGREKPDTSTPADNPRLLAITTAELDDPHRHVTPNDPTWRSWRHAYEHRDTWNDVEHADFWTGSAGQWPRPPGPVSKREALAVVVHLALRADRQAAEDDEMISSQLKRLQLKRADIAKFERERRSRHRRTRARIAKALHIEADSLQRELRRGRAGRPILDHVAARPRLPWIYDPAREQPPPIDASLDGPRSRQVGWYLDAIKRNDPGLADAIVLGIPVEVLEARDRLERCALNVTAPPGTPAGERLEFARDRQHLARHIERYGTDPHRRAEAERARQRHEGKHYGWHSDNLPPGCLKAAREARQREVQALQQLLDDLAA